MTDEIQELTSKDFERAITREQRLRLISGEWKTGDLATLRKYRRRHPDGPAKALLRLIAKYPRLLLHDLEKVS